MKRTPLRRKSLKKKVVKKLPKKGYQEPKWFKAIKPGAHGQTPAQKRLWRVVSEKYRQDDWNTHGPYCVSCGGYLEDWRSGQLAHYKAWANCHGWFKFERKNLALSCGRCNKINDGFVAEKFRQELRRRYGDNVIDWIQQENLRHQGEKLETWALVDYAAKVDPSRVY